MSADEKNPFDFSEPRPRAVPVGPSAAGERRGDGRRRQSPSTRQVVAGGVMCLGIVLSLTVIGRAVRNRDSGVVTVEPREFLCDYLYGNVAAADAKYLNKTIRIRGRVLEIEKAIGGYGIGIEAGPTSSGAAILAMLPDSDRDVVAKMQDSDTVEVEGLFRGAEERSGRQGGILLRLAPARVISHKPQPAPKK